MNPIFDDYDGLEFDDEKRRTRRNNARRERHEKGWPDQRRMPHRYSDKWADDDWKYSYSHDAYDYQGFDDSYDDSWDRVR